MKNFYPVTVTAILLLLYCQTAKIGDENLQLSEMDTVNVITLVTLIILIVQLGIGIWQNAKDRSASHKEHDGIEKVQRDCKDSLKDNQTSSQDFLSSEHHQLKDGQTHISQATSEIRIAVNGINNQLTAERARREERQNCLTDEQRSIQVQINAITAMNQMIPQLQLEKHELVVKNQQLVAENEQLKRENRELRQQMNEDEFEDSTQKIK